MITKFSGTPSYQFLQYAMLPIISNLECNILSDYKRFGYNVSDGQLCAGNITSGGVDSCSGDSGGPLVCFAEGSFVGYVLTGVVSFGPQSCGEPKFPGIYSRVTHYIDWISSKMGDKSTSTPKGIYTNTIDWHSS